MRILLIIFFSFISALFADSGNIQPKLLKNWSIVKYEINGDIFVPDKLHQHDKLEFYDNNKLVMIDGSNTFECFYLIDEKAGIVTIENQTTNEVKYLIIESLTDSSLTILNKEKEGYNIKTFWKLIK